MILLCTKLLLLFTKPPQVKSNTEACGGVVVSLLPWLHGGGGSSSETEQKRTHHQPPITNHQSSTRWWPRVGGPRAYRDQFRGSSLTECMLVGTFYVLHKNWLSIAEGKRAWVSDIRWKPTSSGNAEWTLWAIKKMKGTYGGGEGMTPVTTTCPKDRWG